MWNGQAAALCACTLAVFALMYSYLLVQNVQMVWVSSSFTKSSTLQLCPYGWTVWLLLSLLNVPLVVQGHQ